MKCLDFFFRMSHAFLSDIKGLVPSIRLLGAFSFYHLMMNEVDWYDLNG